MRFSSPCRLVVLMILLAAPATAQEEPRLGDTDARTVFDGKSLEGWVTRGGRYDGTARWAVEGGEMVGREGVGGTGGLIYTRETYRYFVLTCEAWIDYPFDSGVFVNMRPRGGGKGLQLTLDHRPGGEIGGIYSDGWLQHRDQQDVLFRCGAWNRVTVAGTGPGYRLRFWLNGRLITDYRLPEKAKGFAASGRIGLQVHGGGGSIGQRARFRNLRVRRLPSFDSRWFTGDLTGRLRLLPAGQEAGWRPLLGDDDLGAFEVAGDAAGFVVEDGVLHLPREGSPATLRTRDDFRDVELRLEFRTSELANSGVYLRAPRTGGNPTYGGCEIQILDDFDWERLTKSRLKPWQFTGAIYGAAAPGKPGALRPHGDWNAYRIRWVDDRLQVELNGQELHDVDVTTLRAADPPFAERAREGFIGLQRYVSRGGSADPVLSFRNLFVRPR